MSNPAIRFDVGGLGKVSKTPQGFLLVPGNVTRVGVLHYTKSDGATFRELRHPDEVFRDDSIRSLAFAPVTDRHPAELVSPKNVRDLQVGIISNARKDARFVRSDLIVQDERMIAKIERGDARELSAGYTCRVEERSGTFEGERYDGIQRGIVYNHVALGPRDWGRAGRDVALHVDGLSFDVRGAVAVERFDDHLAALLTLHPEAMVPLKTDSAGPTPGKEEPVSTKTIRIDGLEYEVEPKTAAAVARYLDQLEKKVDAEAARADKAEGERDTAVASLEETKVKLDAALDPAAIQAAVRARGTLEASARKVIGPEAKFDAKSDREIKVDAIKYADEKFDATDRSDDYIEGRFSALVEAAPERRDQRDAVRVAVAGPSPVPSTDPKVVKIDSASAAKKASEKAAAALGRSPLPSEVRRNR